MKTSISKNLLACCIVILSTFICASSESTCTTSLTLDNCDGNNANCEVTLADDGKGCTVNPLPSCDGKCSFNTTGGDEYVVVCDVSDCGTTTTETTESSSSSSSSTSSESSSSTTTVEETTTTTSTEETSGDNRASDDLSMSAILTTVGLLVVAVL